MRFKKFVDPSAPATEEPVAEGLDLDKLVRTPEDIREAIHKYMLENFVKVSNPRAYNKIMRGE